MDINEQFQMLKSVLGGNFHQDIDDPENALNEFIDEVNKEWLEYIIHQIELFLNSDFSMKEKSLFIEEATYIYFPAIGYEPVEWLVYVHDVLKNVKR